MKHNKMSRKVQITVETRVKETRVAKAEKEEERKKQEQKE